jgi:uncharacterized protein RhaS with RHS repeats
MDPIGVQGGDTNLYRYALNNPVSYVDPEGTVIQNLPLTMLCDRATPGQRRAIVW